MHDTANPYPEVPLPAGAVDVDGWYPPHVTGHPRASRYFVGSKRIVAQRAEAIEVTIDGIQHADSRVERLITVSYDGREALTELSPAAAREVAATRLAASDEIEGAIRAEWT
jgi:hypothetical protein